MHIQLRVTAFTTRIRQLKWQTQPFQQEGPEQMGLDRELRTGWAICQRNSGVPP